MDAGKHLNKNVMKKEDNSKLKATPKNKENAKYTKASNKCKGCKKEYKNLNNHLKRSFSCQDYYKIDDLINLCQSSQNLCNQFVGEESKGKHVEDLKLIKKENHQEMPLNKEKGKQYLSCLDSNNWLNDETSWFPGYGCIHLHIILPYSI